MSRTRSVSVCVAIAGLLLVTASRAHAAEGMLPNGAELTFERLKIFEGGAFKEPSTPDALRLYLNQAHCVCAAAGLGTQTEVEWEMKLSVTTQTSRPASLWVGDACNTRQSRESLPAGQLDLRQRYPRERTGVFSGPSCYQGLSTVVLLQATRRRPRGRSS